MYLGGAGRRQVAQRNQKVLTRVQRKGQPGQKPLAMSGGEKGEAESGGYSSGEAKVRRTGGSLLRLALHCQASEGCTVQSWDTVRPLLPLPLCQGFTIYSLTVEPGNLKGCSRVHWVLCHREARRCPLEKQGCSGQVPCRRGTCTRSSCSSLPPSVDALCPLS